MSKNNYIDNPELQDHFVRWLTDNPEGENMPNEIGEAILLVANNTVRRWNFNGYSADWKEDMVSEAVWNAVRYCRRYNFEKYSNPHAYLTMICFRSFTNVIKKNKRANEVKFEMIVDELERIGLDEHRQDIDPDLLSDFYEKANIQLPEEKEELKEEIPSVFDKFME